MNRQRISYLFGTFLLISIIASSWSNAVAQPLPAQSIVVTFWYTENDVEKPTLLAKVAAFEAANPNIDVQAQQKGFFSAEGDFRTAFVAGTEPNVFRASRDAVPAFASEGMIQNVSSAFTDADKSDFLPQSLKLMTFNGTIWGFPQAIDCPAYFFNKALFDAGGVSSAAISYSTSWTWEEFETNIAKINSTTSGVYALSLAGMFYGAQPYYYGKGGYFVSDKTYDDSHIAINTTKSREALTYLKNLVNSSLTPDWTLQGWSNFVGDFMKGKVAMIATGPWEIANLLQNSAQFNGTTHDASNLGMMLVPHDSDGNYGSLIGGNYYVISSSVMGEKLSASLAFADYLSGPDAMALSAINDYHVPARKSVMDNASVKAAASYKYVQAFFEQSKKAFSLIPSPYYGPMENDLGSKIDEYLAGDITLDQCLEETTALWKARLPSVAPPYEETTGIDGFNLSLFAIFGLATVYLILRKKKFN